MTPWITIWFLSSKHITHYAVLPFWNLLSMVCSLLIAGLSVKCFRGLPIKDGNKIVGLLIED